MTGLLYAPALTYADTTYYLPPWMEVESERSQEVTSYGVAQTDRKIITSIRQNQGASLGLKLSSRFETPTTAQVLALIEDLWAHFAGKKFNLHIWSDRAWKNCALLTMRDRMGTDPLTYLENCGIEILCEYPAPDTSLQLPFTDYNLEYPYAAYTRQYDLGDAVSSGESVPVATSVQSESNTFRGVVEAATADGKEHRFVVGGPAGRQWRLKSLEIPSAMPGGATGTTKIRVATYPVGGSPGSQIDATVGAAAYYGPAVTGDITVVSGATLYVSVVTAGGHQDVHYRVLLEAK